MGMQVPSGMDSEIPEESSVWTTSEGSGTSPSGVGIAQGECSVGREDESGSCPHDGIDSAEVFGGPSGWIRERKECDLGGKGDGTESEFLGSAFLGPRILRFNSWLGRRDDTRTCPQPRRS